MKECLSLKKKKTLTSVGVITPGMYKTSPHWTSTIMS
jgi:hypothetical protein